MFSTHVEVELPHLGLQVFPLIFTHPPLSLVKMSSTSICKSKETPKETLDVFFHLKALILCNSPSLLIMTSSALLIPSDPANAKLANGATINGKPRSYDVATTSRVRGQAQYRVMIVGYEENHKVGGKVDTDSKVLLRSAVKLNLNQAMEDLLKKTQEELWKD